MSGALAIIVMIIYIDKDERNGIVCGKSRESNQMQLTEEDNI